MASSPINSYNPNFIEGYTIDFPKLSNSVKSSCYDSGRVIEHTYFALVFNVERNLAHYTAHNIDGATMHPEGDIPRKDDFREDPKIPANIQIDDRRGYKNNPWDRGHMVRRRSLHWGDRETAVRADNESFYWSNISPQHTRLHATAWGSIEDWMLDFTEDNKKQSAVFTGPIFTPYDPEHQNFPDQPPYRIPAGFWKIIAIESDSKLKAASFLVWQRDYDRNEPLKFDPVLEQVRLTTIEYLTGMIFEDLTDADVLKYGETKALVEDSQIMLQVNTKEDIII